MVAALQIDGSESASSLPDAEAELVVVEQQKLNPAAADYVAALTAKPAFAKDILVNQRHILANLADFWPEMPGWTQQAQALRHYIGDLVRSYPVQTATPYFLLRICVSSKPLSPLTIPQANEDVSIATFDSTSGILQRCFIPKTSSLPELSTMTIQSGVMVLCQSVPPLINAYRDSIPLSDTALVNIFSWYSGRSRDKIFMGYDDSYEPLSPLYPKSMIITARQLRILNGRLADQTRLDIIHAKKQAIENLEFRLFGRSSG